MKRYYLPYLILPILITLFLTLIPNHAISQIYSKDISLEPRIVINGEVKESPKINFESYCYDVYTLKIGSCHFKVEIDEAYDENDCQGAANTACGHQDGLHTDSRSNILKKKDAEAARILGGFTDAQKPAISTELPERRDQLEYYYDYYSGEISGKIKIKIIATLNIAGSFLSPCESARVCTLYRNIKAEHCGDSYLCQRFVELAQPTPPPLLPDPLDWSLYWDGYVRCGKESNCTNIPDNINPANWLDYDDPYNWLAHPTTDWGNPSFLSELKLLAQRWYKTFGKPLVINDISLPKGGLLDVNTDWKTPHSSHRKGVDADILKVSVPDDGRRPTRSSDTKWLDLYREFDLFKDSNLKCLEKERDYNHLQQINYINVITIP